MRGNVLNTLLQVCLQDLNLLQYLVSYCLYFVPKDKTSENSAKKGAYLNAYFWHLWPLAPLLYRKSTEGKNILCALTVKLCTCVRLIKSDNNKPRGLNHVSITLADFFQKADASYKSISVGPGLVGCREKLWLYVCYMRTTLVQTKVVWLMPLKFVLQKIGY